MKAPACDPGDFGIALRAKSALFMPEIAKSAGTPKRFQHVSPFAFFEVGFIGWIVRVGFAFYLDVSFDGSALDPYRIGLWKGCPSTVHDCSQPRPDRRLATTQICPFARMHA